MKKEKLTWETRILAAASGLVFAPIMFGLYCFLTNVPFYEVIPISLLSAPIFAIMGFVFGPSILAFLFDFR